MTPRDRILATLDHRPVDRIPLGLDANTGITARLFKHFKVNDLLSLYSALGIDGFSVFNVDYVYPNYIGPKPQTLPDGTSTDFFGIRCQHHWSLAFAESVKDLDDYPWPSADWFDYSTVKERCLAIQAKGRPSVGGEGGCGIVHAMNLRGDEQALLDPYDNPDLAHAYMHRMGDFFVEWNERWLAAADGHFDIYRCGDDVGSMLNMHCRPEIWREFYKPQFKRIFAVAKKHGLKIWFHCCGYCRPILPDLVEIGVDMWDPAPPTVRDNDLPCIKRELGDRLTFVGAVNHPDVLVRGTPSDVEREVKLRIEQLSPGGGYILGPAQVLTDDIPVDNVLAMYAAALRYGGYS
ncbi:MAG TPA: uroporphyrinogen decarboxylase family protein [Tepidisphaeraceae bacterium]|jgi:uroporphyrinogen decarboxylase